MLKYITFSARRHHRAVLAAGAAAMLASCGGGGGGGPTANGGQTPTPSPSPSASPPATAGCTLRERQDWVLARLQEWYLFPALLNTTVNPASHASVDSYIDALTAPARAQSRDRYFTYMTSIAEENAYYSQGATAGFGFRLGYDYSGNRVFVIEAFEGTPALANGLDRGVELIAIQTPGGFSQPVAALMAAAGPAGVIDAMGPDTAGTTRTLMVREPSGVQRTVTLAKADYQLDPVSSRYGAKVLLNGARKVGYLNLRAFIETAEADLLAAFATFKAEGVDDLIVDLRYNGGGLIGTSEVLGDLMGAGRGGSVFNRLAFRESKAAENFTRTFMERAESIAPARIAFIGTGSTASASELVINAMVPYLGTNMALVGSNTYGKPVGQIAFDQPLCDDRLRVVAFKSENAAGQGEYYTGLAGTVPVTCQAPDDISRPLGDPNEAMLRTALQFVGGGSCVPIAGAAAGATASTERVGAAPQRRALTREVPRSTIERELPGVY